MTIKVEVIVTAILVAYQKIQFVSLVGHYDLWAGILEIGSQFLLFISTNTWLYIIVKRP